MKGSPTAQSRPSNAAQPAGPERPHNSTQSPGAKIPEFDLLRALAILLLFLHHGGLYNFSVSGFPLSRLSSYNALFLLGAFTFVSGYLSVRSLEKHSLSGYFKSRLVRIYVPYLAALLLFIGYLDVDLSQTGIAVHLFGAQMLLSPRLTTPVYTLWYVGMILAYYLLFGLLQKTIRSTPLLALAVVGLFIAAGLVRAEWGFIARRFFYYYFVFAAGLFVARLDLLPRLTTPRFFLLDKLLLAGLGVAAFAPFSAEFGTTVSLPLVAAAVFFSLSMLLLALSLARLLIAAGLPQRPVEFIASASFFAYLLHRPIWKVLAALYTTPNLPVMFLYLTVAGSIVILAVSGLLQRLYDRLLEGKPSRDV